MVLLDEKSLRFGRPAERPRGAEPKETPTVYRMAMAIRVSYYGAEPGDAPQRLCGRYAALIPEGGYPTFKRRLEAAERTFVKTRLCQSGMRWSRLGGQRILTLRAYVKFSR